MSPIVEGHHPELLKKGDLYFVFLIKDGELVEYIHDDTPFSKGDKQIGAVPSFCQSVFKDEEEALELFKLLDFVYSKVPVKRIV